MSSRSIILVVSLACLVLALFAFSAIHPLPFGSVGTIDFFQYWYSWGAIREGNNPYDPILAGEIQKATPHISLNRFMSWNPPWTFVLLSPFTSGPFERCAMFWMAFQVVLLGVIAHVTPLALGERVPSLVLRAVTPIVFFPALESLYYGQLGVLLATSVALFLFFQQHGSFFLAGLSLLPLSVKPHLFVLFILPGAQWLLGLPRSQALRFMCGALAGFTLLISITCTLAPHVLYDWIAAMRGGNSSSFTEGTIPFPFWQTATLTTWIRIALTSHEIPSWPLTVVPLAALIGTITYFLRQKGPIIWKDIAPPLLCLSLVTSSYGWVFDQSVLIVPHTAIICGALSLQRRAVRVVLLATAFGLQILAIYLSDMPQHFFVWLPIAILLLFLAQRAMGSSQRKRKLP